MKKLTAKQLLVRPFEVYYSRLAIRELQFMYALTPESIKDFTHLEVKMGNSVGLTFRCENKTGGELLCTIGNDFEAAVPAWLEIINEADCNINSIEIRPIKISDGKIKFLSKVDDRDGDNDIKSSLGYFGEAFSYYVFDENQDADYFVLDADGERIKISQDGFAIDEDGIEDENTVIFDCSDDDNLAGKAYDKACVTARKAQDMSAREAIDKLIENWINNQLSTFLKSRKLKLLKDFF